MPKPDNYFVVHGWMLSDLKLKGNELLVYAILYGFSQDGESQYSGSIPYLCDWTAASRSSVHGAIKNLMEKGLVRRITDAPDHSCYQAFRHPKASIVGGQKNPEGVQNLDRGVQNLDRGVQNLDRGCPKFG